MKACNVFISLSQKRMAGMSDRCSSVRRSGVSLDLCLVRSGLPHAHACHESLSGLSRFATCCRCGRDRQKEPKQMAEELSGLSVHWKDAFQRPGKSVKSHPSMEMTLSPADFSTNLWVPQVECMLLASLSSSRAPINFGPTYLMQIFPAG